MNEPLGLFLDRNNDFRGAMAENVDRNAADKVQILLAAGSQTRMPRPLRRTTGKRL
jgi:hypothetical protein